MSTYLVAGIILLVTLVAVAISTIGRARRLAVQNEVIPEDELAEFQRMHEAGEINDEEYRKMKQIVVERTADRAKGE